MNDVQQQILTVLAVIGWIGVAIQLIAYARLSSGRLRASSVSYQGLNVMGALAVGASSAASGAWPSTVANIIWVGIGVVAILALRRQIIERRMAAARRMARRRAAELMEVRRRRGTRRSVVSPAGSTAEAAEQVADLGDGEGPASAQPSSERSTPAAGNASTRPAGRPGQRRRRRSTLAA